MHSPAPRRRWLAWALLLAAPMASAQSLQCGLFKADEGSSTLRISSPNRGEQKHFGSAPSPVVFQQIDGKLQLVNLEYGLPSALQVRDRGRTVEVDGTVYLLQTPAQCAAAAMPAEGSCRPMRRRAGQPSRSDPGRPEAGCREGVPGMCLQLADRWHEEAKPTVEADPARQRQRSTPPCRASNSPPPVTMAASNREPRRVRPHSRPTPQCRSSWSRPR
ncbi:hypothetical protein NMB32_04580 [Stenotrophomonas sp. CD2]|nr:hypothetical protein NMB32_04580 [Stenotrophomonas sp. CD2]